MVGYRHANLCDRKARCQTLLFRVDMADSVGEAGLAGDFLRDGRGLPEIVIQVGSGFRIEKGEVAERGHVGRAYGRPDTGGRRRCARLRVSRHACEGFSPLRPAWFTRNLLDETEQVVHPSEALAGHRKFCWVQLRARSKTA